MLNLLSTMSAAHSHPLIPSPQARLTLHLPGDSQILSGVHHKLRLTKQV
jgi:hypothetical protein